LGVVEIVELVKSLEEEFGVSAAAVAVAWWAVDWGESAWSDLLKVELTEIWQQKIAVIKVIKEVLWVWLKDAKALVEKAPVIVKEDLKDEEAEWIKTKLEEAGATVNLK
jgi:large subunit ribosomal protein L7/L12